LNSSSLVSVAHGNQSGIREHGAGFCAAVPCEQLAQYPVSSEAGFFALRRQHD